MRLLSLPQLQSMFQIAQELIGVGKVVEVFAADVFLVVQLLQGKHRAARAQPGFSASVDALQTLHQKLDVANSAAIKLHVDAALRLLP